MADRIKLLGVLREIERADVEYHTAEEFYRGRRTEVFSSSRAAKALSKTAGSWRVNIAAGVVDAVTEKCQVSELRVLRGGRRDRAAQELFDEEVSRPNNLMSQVKQAIRLAERHGDAYILVWPKLDYEEDPDAEFSVTGVEIVVYPATGMRVFYDAQRPWIATHAVHTWLIPGERDGEELRRVDVMYADGRTESWVSRVPAASVVSEDQFAPVLSDPDDPESWISASPFGQLCVHHVRNDETYGVPEHASVYGPQNQLTKELATMLESLDGFALPVRMGLAEPATAGTGEFDEDDEDDFADDPTAVRAEAGDVKIVSGIREIVQLQPGAVSNFLDPIDKTLSLASTVSRTPMGWFDLASSAVSGESRREHLEPLLTKVSDRRDFLHVGIDSAATQALRVLTGDDDLYVQVVWRSALKPDPKTGHEAVEAAVAAGVPRQVALVLYAGHEEAAVEEWPAPEDSMTARVDLLDSVAGALLKIQQAVTLGSTATGGTPVVTPELLTALLSGLTDSAEDDPTGDDGE